MSVDQYKKEIGMMNLEKLIQDREGISSKKFPIEDKELLFRYEQLYTGAVNDVMREFCLLEQALPGRIKPLREYHFVVWDTSRDDKATLWGGVMTATAKGKKLKAACIDGGIRDTHQILNADFPVFYEYRISNGSLGRCLITHYQIPIKIGDVTIKPGDIILGDIDGVLVVPREIAYEVLLRSEEIRENEKKIFSWVQNGDSVQEITAKGGYF